MSELQISTLRQDFDNMKGDTSDVTSPIFIRWCNYIMDFAWRKLRNVDPERFLSSQSYSITTHPQTEALPSDFSKMDIKGCGIYLVEDNGAGDDTDIRLARTGFGRSDAGYYLDGNNIVFTGVEGNTYKLKYIPKRTRFTAVTDYFNVNAATGGVIVIDDEWTDYLLQALDIKYSQWDEDPGSESNADQRFTRVLSEMLNEYKRDTKVISVSSPVNLY